jgi:integration host factor subunit beta
VRQYRSYDGRNPCTGAIVPVRPKRLAFFKVGKEMRERVNKGGKDNDKQWDKDRNPKRTLSS